MKKLKLAAKVYEEDGKWKYELYLGEEGGETVRYRFDVVFPSRDEAYAAMKEEFYSVGETLKELSDSAGIDTILKYRETKTYLH